MIDTKISKKATNDELELAVKSQTAYSEWRALDDDPREHGYSDLRCLQIDLIRWEVHNFGTQKQWVSALGMFEELGELLEAIEEADDNEIADAFADFMVYSVNLCTKTGLDFECIMEHAHSQVGTLSGLDTLMAIWKSVGRLSHIILKSEQKIRGYDDRSVKRRDAAIVIGRMVAAVTELAFAADFGVEAVLFAVAADVMKRDWVKYPVTGLPEEPYGAESDSFTSGGCASGPSTLNHYAPTDEMVNDVVGMVEREAYGVPETEVSPARSALLVEKGCTPTVGLSSVPETGKYQDSIGVTRFMVDGREVTEQVFLSERR